MASPRTKQLILLDEDNRKFYSLIVSPEECENAKKEPGFGAKLLAEFLETGQPVTIEDLNIEENSTIDLCTAMQPNNCQSEPIESSLLINDPINLSFNKNVAVQVEQQSHQIFTTYNWQEEETFLLIDCYDKERVHTLVKKKDISSALERVVTNFNNILLEKKGKTIPFSKCCSKIDSLKRLYREKIDLQKKSGGQPCTWPYFETLHIFHKECWVKPLSIAGSNIEAKLDVQVVEPRTKTKPIQLVLEEMAEARRIKNEYDKIKHREKMIRLDRFNNCMESMAESFSVIAAAKKAKIDSENVK